MGGVDPRQSGVHDPAQASDAGPPAHRRVGQPTQHDTPLRGKPHLCARRAVQRWKLPLGGDQDGRGLQAGVWLRGCVVAEDLRQHDRVGLRSLVTAIDPCQ